MSRITAYFTVVLGVAAAVLVGAGCGAGGADGLPSNVVARVGDRAITKPMLEHWTVVQSISNYETSPKRPAPRWVIPDPPGYAACITHLQATREASGQGGSKPSPAELKNACRHEYETVRAHALGVLIHFDWLFGEAAELGMKLGVGDVEREFARFKREVFGSEAAFRKYLMLTRLSLAEELMRYKINLLSELLRRRVAPAGSTPQQQQRALASFGESYTRKWTSSTNCRAGYVVPGCRQYRGPR